MERRIKPQVPATAKMTGMKGISMNGISQPAFNPWRVAAEGPTGQGGENFLGQAQILCQTASVA